MENLVNYINESKSQNSDLMVYWNVDYFEEEDSYYLLIDKYDGYGLSDDEDFASEVYKLIENELPEYHLSAEAESFFSIYPKDDDGKYNYKRPLKTKQEANEFIDKLKKAFPKWKREKEKRC